MNRRVDTRVQYPHYRQPSRTPPPPVAIPPLLGVLPPLVAALPPDATAAPCPVARPRAAPPPGAALSVTGSRRGTALGLALALRAFTIVAAICVNLWRAVSSASQASRRPRLETHPYSARRLWLNRVFSSTPSFVGDDVGTECLTPSAVSTALTSSASNSITSCSCSGELLCSGTLGMAARVSPTARRLVQAWSQHTTRCALLGSGEWRTSRHRRAAARGVCIECAGRETTLSTRRLRAPCRPPQAGALLHAVIVTATCQRTAPHSPCTASVPRT